MGLTSSSKAEVERPISWERLDWSRTMPENTKRLRGSCGTPREHRKLLRHRGRRRGQGGRRVPREEEDGDG